MKKQKNMPPRLFAACGVLCALLVGGAEWALWKLSGYGPLQTLALLQLLPAVLQLLLLLPEGREFEQKPPVAAPEEKNFRQRLLYGLRVSLRWIGNGLRRLANIWYAKKNGILAVVLAAGILAANLLLWPGLLKTARIGAPAYWAVVAVAALFVVSVAAEKWMAHVAKGDGESRTCAIAANLKGMLGLGRIGQALTALAMVLQLIGIYDSRLILQLLLAVLFAYEALMLVLSLAIRLIRKELFSDPRMPLSPKAMGGVGILSYLEENTGITMRSLWSMRLIRQLLPGIALFVVLLTWLSTGIVQIEAHQEGALYRLGRLQKESLKPGLHLTLPWPMDKVEVVDTQSLRRVVVGYVPGEEVASDNTWTEGHGKEEYRLLLGGGNEMISINLVVEYRIGDLALYMKNSANAEALLQAAAYEIVTERTIVTNIETLLAEDRTGFSESFQIELSERMKKLEIGVEVVNVVLESIHPPVEVADIYQRMATAEIQAEQMITEAEWGAVLAVTAAEQQKRALISIANTTYHQKIATAVGADMEFKALVAAYQAYPDAFTFYKFTEALTQAYKKGVLIIVGEGVDSGALVIGDLSRPILEDPYYLDPEVEEEYFE